MDTYLPATDRPTPADGAADLHGEAPAAEASATYELIAAAIRYLRLHAGRQPSLGELAAYIGLSEWHLQRLFTAWVGVSPKRFLQCLTKEHAKALLRERASVLDATLASGLSGPGRLHDLLVTCDAISPGEAGALGAGLEIAWGVHRTPFGPALIALTARGVCRVEFVAGDVQPALAALQAEWPAARLSPAAAATATVARQMFAPLPDASHARPLHLLLKGSNFQIQVWQALLRIPPGALVSYRALASAIGRPTASRAVGGAVGTNALAVLIPCHRVIRESGDLGGYRWGIERKQALLAWEACARGSIGE